MSAFGVTRHAPLEHLAARVGFAALLLYSTWALARFSGQPAPVGIARWLDLSFATGPLYPLWFVLFLLALAAYVAGKALPAALTYLSAYCIVMGTLRNSQGGVGHSEQLMVLVLLAQTLAYLSTTRLTRRFGFQSQHDPRDLALHYSKQMVAAIYVTAAISKLIETDGGWFNDASHMAVSMVKAVYQEYYNHLEPGLREQALARATWMFAHPSFTRIFFGLGLFTELLAFLALYNRFSALLVGVALLALHEGVRILMSINFYYNSWVILIFLVNIPGALLFARSRLRKST